MTCDKCGEKPKKSCGAFPKAVIEINNPEQIVLIRKVLIPASMGDESTFPPTIGKYHNVLLEYEASGGIYLYSSDGIPTKLSSDVTELQAQLNALRVRVGEEEVARADADTALSNRITSLDNSLATVAKTGSYNDLSNKPTIGNGTLTIKKNGTVAGTFTANATTNKEIDISIPTKTSDLTNDGSDGTSTYVEADELPTVDRAYSALSNNAIANSTVTNSLNRDVMTNLVLDTNPSTTTINLNNVKTNLANPSSSTTTSIPLPVASSTQAGVMNSATFDAVTNNTNNINAIMNGAVAISNLPASPTQAQLTTAWENETGLTSLINRASVYDVTNNKVWTYYTNDQTWHAASNTSQVSINTFTNSSEGTIKGSTNNGQVFAENDGTGSVNGWDTLTGNVASNTSKLATIEQGAEVNVQANWSQTDTTADDYIKNKPTIPTVNNATLTIQKNGTNVQTFTANSSTNKTANITVPTAVSELTNDAGYATTTQLNNGLATKQDTLTAGNNIQINGSTISATDTTYTAGNAIDITNGEISADIHPADFFTAEGVVSDCGSDLSLDDTIASTLESVELKGDTFQQTYSGEQLLTKNGLATPSTDTAFWNQLATGVISYTPLSDGWARVVQNSSGFGNIMVRTAGVEGFSTGTTYTVIFEIRNVSGAGTTFDEFKAYDIAQSTSTNDPWEGSTLQIVEGARWRSGTNVYVPLQDAQTPQYAVFVGTTKSSSTGYSLRTFTRSTVPIGTTLEVRATVLSGDHSSDWRNYCGENWQPFVGGAPAPNPDYPQDIQVVAGEQTVTVTGKNLFDKNTVVLYNGYFSASGRISGDSSSDLTVGTDRFFYIPCEPNTTYSITKPLQSTTSYNRFRVGTQPVLNTTGGSALNDFWYMSDGGTTTTHTITTGANANYLFVYFAKATTATNPGGEVQEVLDGLQIEKGPTATDYEPYQGQSYTVDLGSIELCKIGSYQDYIYKSGDDWYLHKEIGAFDLSTGTYVATTSSIRGLTNAPNIKYVPNNQTIGSAVTSGYKIRQGQGLGTAGVGWFAVDTNRVNFNTGGSTDPVGMLYYALETPTDIQITDTILVAELNALAGAKSYNDQTNILATAAGYNLPATLCVEAHRKSLSGVIEAIDSACTCHKNLVVYLPNGMTTYENNDAPIPIPEVLEAFKRGQSVFLVDAGLSGSVYVVTAANAYDGVWTMRADQTGINSDVSDGHWHISGRDNLWRRVEFIPDTEQDSVINLSVVFDDSSWGTPSEDYRVLTGSGETTIGVCNLSAAQGNAGLFVNDDTGEFITVGEAYELIASGERVKFNNVPVGQYLSSPHTYSGSGEDVFSGIELPVKYFINVDGVYVTEYTNSVVLPRSKGVPPLGVSIQKIDQDDPEEDTYEFIIQGKM